MDAVTINFTIRVFIGFYGFPHIILITTRFVRTKVKNDFSFVNNPAFLRLFARFQFLPKHI